MQLPRSKNKTIEEQFPNPGELTIPEERKMNEDNHFQNHEKEMIAKKYVQMSVLFEYLNEVLELPPESTIEIFGVRVRDLIIASRSIE